MSNNGGDSLSESGVMEVFKDYGEHLTQENKIKEVSGKKEEGEKVSTSLFVSLISFQSLRDHLRDLEQTSRELSAVIQKIHSPGSLKKIGNIVKEIRKIKQEMVKKQVKREK